MNIIPYVRLIFGIVAFGFMYYLYNNIYDMIVAEPHFAESAVGPTHSIMFIMWMALPTIYLIYAGVRLIMDVQRRQGIP